MRPICTFLGCIDDMGFGEHHFGEELGEIHDVLFMRGKFFLGIGELLTELPVGFLKFSSRFHYR